MIAMRLVLVFWVAGSVGPALGKTESAGLGPLNPAETWILQQVAAGLSADLQDRFGPEERPRQLRAAFLEALLMKGDPAKTMFVRFFLSMDEFLPGVDLGLAKLWQISKISFPMLLYYHFHKIAGWVLIPIGLAAVLTQFK